MRLFRAGAKPAPKPKPRVVAKPAEPLPPPPEPAPAPEPAPPPPERAAVASGPASPREACGGRIFVALARCLSRECETPRFKNHPECVKLRAEDKARQEQIFLPSAN